MKVSTIWDGRREAGKSYEDIPSDVAERWKKNGIADIVDDEDEGPYAGKKAKELYEMCIAAGIETEPRLSKAEYIALLDAKAKAAEIKVQE
jgi:hypothetical protein